MITLPEPLTAEWINRLSVEERKEVLAGDFGKRMFAWASSYIMPFRWTRRTRFGTIVNGGTCFSLDLDRHLYLITAAHVYAGFLEHKEMFGDSIKCYVGHPGHLFEPIGHLRDGDKGTDLAIFNYTYEDLANSKGTQAIVATCWPPPPEPIANWSVFLGGFPGEGRLWLQPNATGIGRYLCYTPITAINDRQILCRFDRKDWVKRTGVPLPRFRADLGGISGGPVLLPLDNGLGEWDFYLAGIITEASASAFSETVVAVRSHFINLNGTISPV
jgi:hypothetical protein